MLGKDFRRAATASEIAAMAQLLERDLAAGALGLVDRARVRPGHLFEPRRAASPWREVAARHGGRYISHVRSEDRWFWEAIDEILAIGREAKLPVQISHIKLAMRSLWGQAPQLLALPRRGAPARGSTSRADIYPYLYWHSTLTVLFPERDFENLDDGAPGARRDRAGRRPAARPLPPESRLRRDAPSPTSPKSAARLPRSR